MGPDIFRKDSNYIYLNIPYCEFYIPTYYFDPNRRFAEDYVDKISVFGIFNVGIFEGGKLKELKTLNLPTYIDIWVYDSEIRQVKLGSEQLVECKVCKYFEGNLIMNSAIPEDSSNVEAFLNMVTGGSLPITIPYTEVLAIWRKNLELNNVSLGVSSSILELILSAVFRNPDNLEQKFSKLIGADMSVSPFHYKLASIRQICQYTSTFTAITFEDMDSMITTSVNRFRDGREEPVTPLEKVIRM